MFQLLKSKNIFPPDRIAGDTSDAKTLYSLGWDLLKIGKIDSSILYSEAGLSLSKKLNFKNGIAAALGNKASALAEKGQSSKAIELHFEALKIATETGNLNLQAINLNNIGVIYFHLMEYDKAMTNYSRAFKIDESRGNKRGMATRLGNLGNVHHANGNNALALKYYFKALKLRQELGLKRLVGSTLQNIGTVYMHQGDSSIQKDNLDFAFEKKYALAIRYYSEAIAIAEEVQDKASLCLVLNNLGNLQMKTGEDRAAQISLLRALNTAREIGSPENQCGVMRDLSKLYESANKVLPDSSGTRMMTREEMLRKALFFRSGYIALKDTLLNEETKRQLTVKEMNYEFGVKEALLLEKQNQERVLAEERQNRQKVISISIAGGLILVFIFAIYVFQTLKTTRIQKGIIEVKQKEITDSINYAERIQRSFLASADLMDENLNSRLLNSENEKSYFVFFQPKDIVSGDFYWAAKLKDGRFALVTADSTGHGVPGAIMSILNISTLENAIEEKQLTAPAEILNYTRAKIIERLKKDGSAEGGKDGMDCSLLILDQAKKQLSYSAANSIIWVVRKKNLIVLNGDKMPVGKHNKDNIPFTQYTFDLENGDMIYTLTDGMPDQFGGPKEKKFMQKRLKDLLIKQSEMKVGLQKENIETALREWKGEQEQVDDITVIGVRV